MVYRFAKIPLSTIDSTDDTYRVSSDGDVGMLAKSIRSFGLINPPIVSPNPNRVVILSGFRRIEACRQLEWPDIDVRMVGETVDDLHCCAIAITENTYQRPLNHIETSRAIHMISSLCADVPDLTELSHKLGLPDSPAMIGKLKGLCLLPQPLQQGVLSGTLSLAMALELGRLEPAAAVAFAGLFDELKPSLNKQRELITLVREIGHREELTILALMTSDDLMGIVTDDNLDRTQKTRRIRNHLRRRRYPSLSGAEERFDDAVRALSLKRGMRVIPPRNFEGETYILQMPFKDQDELRQHERELERVANHTGLADLLIR